MLIPDATIDTTDREWLIGQYNGIPAAPVSPTGLSSSGGVDIRLYDSTGKRKIGAFREWISTLRFEVLERGGFGQASFDALATWEENTIVGGDRLDVWIWSQLIYRGYVRMPHANLSETQRTAPTVYGRMETLNGYQADCKYAYGSPVDLSRLVQDVVADHVQKTNRLPLLVTDLQTIGVKVQEFESRGRNVTQALNAICDLAPNQCIWGFDVNAAGQDRLYFRPRSSTITHRFALGGIAVEYDQESDISAVVNRAAPLRGGTVLQPNLAPDGSYEDAAPNSETVGNLVVDYSEEIGTGWTLNGGATRKGPGDHGRARTGSYWIELDTNGENATQTIAIDYRVPLVAWCWASRETAGTLREVRLTVEGLDAGNATVVTFTTGYIDPAQGASSDLYYRIPNIQTGDSLDCDFSPYATVTQAKITVQTNGGTAADDGVDVDDVALVEKDGATPISWRYVLNGSGKRARLVWQQRDFEGIDPFHGCYGVLAQASGADDTGNNMEIRITEAARISVRPNNPYTFAVRARTDGNSGTFKFVIYEYKSDGTLAATTVSGVQTTNSTDWVPFYYTFQTNGDTAQVEIALRLVDNVEHGFDAVYFGYGSAPGEIIATGDDGGYWPADKYERYADVTNTKLTLNTLPAASITNYGIQEQPIESDAVTNWDPLAKTFLQDYFNAHAIPPVRARLRLYGPDAPLTIDGTVRLLNLASPPSALYPSRVSYTVDTAITIDAELGDGRPDMADLLTLTEQRAKRGL